MRLSDDRINYLSHHIIRTLVREGLIGVSSEAKTVQDIKCAMIKFLRDEEALDQRVRAKITSIKRGIPEGSREWDVLYEQYYGEEVGKMR